MRNAQDARSQPRSRYNRAMSAPPLSWPQLDDDVLRDLAGEGAFARGKKYTQEGRAQVEEVSAHQVTGSVRGGARYDVALFLDGDEVHGDCNCPAAADGDFCKHQVALALTARGAGASAESSSAEASLAAFLRAQSVELLADKLLSIAAEYREVEKDLLFWHKSTQAESGAELNKVIGALLRGGGFVDYRKSFDYARRVDQVAELLRGLVKSRPAVCAEAAEYALLRLFTTLEQSDDSAGAISGAMGELVKLHRKALSSMQPDKKYGARFFKLMLADGWGFFELKTYRALLGEAAWSEYGRCIEAAHAKLPPPAKSKDRWSISEESLGRKHLMRMLETWYVLNDDREALLALKTRELQEPRDYMNLIKQLREYGRHREALQWAEKAHRQFPEDAGFYDALIVCYRHDGLDEEADALLWQWFEKWPGAKNFAALMKQAGKREKAWRERAFAYLETCEVAAWERARKRDPKAPRDVSTRLEVLLNEKRVEEAVAITRDGAAPQHLWLRLADQAKKRYPEVSLPIYRREIELLAEIGGNQNYARANDFLKKLLPLLPKDERPAYLNELRARYKAKRNFIKLLDTL